MGGGGGKFITKHVRNTGLRPGGREGRGLIGVALHPLTEGEDSFSERTTPFSTSSVSEAPVGNTMPGQSMRKMRFMRVMYCHTFVSPGMGATLQLFFFTRELITLLLPTFG